MRVSASRFRIPDVCLISRDQPIERVFTRPPLACIEILSPSDTLTALQERIDDYLGFGVRTVWVLDPIRGRGWIATGQGLVEPSDATFSVAGTPISVSLEDLFADLD